jgi:hypothetical protein
MENIDILDIPFVKKTMFDAVGRHRGLRISLRPWQSVNLLSIAKQHNRELALIHLVLAGGNV